MTTKTLSGTDTESLGRLETKIRKLVDMVGDLRAERQKLADDNVRLQNQVTSLEARLATESESASDAAALRAEREHVRTRVASLLDQLDALEL